MNARAEEARAVVLARWKDMAKGAKNGRDLETFAAARAVVQAGCVYAHEAAGRREPEGATLKELLDATRPYVRAGSDVQEWFRRILDASNPIVHGEWAEADEGAVAKCVEACANFVASACGREVANALDPDPATAIAQAKEAERQKAAAKARRAIERDGGAAIAALSKEGRRGLAAAFAILAAAAVLAAASGTNIRLPSAPWKTRRDVESPLERTIRRAKEYGFDLGVWDDEAEEGEEADGAPV